MVCDKRWLWSRKVRGCSSFCLCLFNKLRTTCCNSSSVAMGVQTTAGER